MSESVALLGEGITRRAFLKTTGIATGVTVAGMPLLPRAMAFAGEGGSASEDQIFNCNCRSNCMGSCRLMAYVRDGKIMKLEPGDYPEEGYTGCCLKGLSYVERIYSKTRIQYPMRRAEGTERGAGEWERISWDEAIQEIASTMKSTIENYGGSAIVFDAASGNYGYLNGVYGLFPRLSACIGATKTAACYDYAAGHGIDRVLGTGDWKYCNEPNSALDASMVVIWGTNPVLTHPHNWRWIRRAQENGTKVVTIDPIKSATAHRSDEFICVNPGHDGYLALAMCAYIAREGLVDWDFIKAKTDAPFLVRKDTGLFLRKSDYEETAVDDFYVWDLVKRDIVPYGEAEYPAYEGSFTTKDGIEVTTAYTMLHRRLRSYSIAEAARLTGLDGDYIKDFARRFATERAVSVNITYGLDHYVNGYLNTWAVAILLALTGNLMRPGAGFIGVFTTRWSPETLGLWITKEYKQLNATVPYGALAEAASTQMLAGRAYPIKTMVSYCSNPASNFPGQRDFYEKLLPNLDLYVVIDLEMTDSAKCADIVLPAASWYEVEDVRAGYNNPYSIYQEKAIEPLYESKADWEIAFMLGQAMGFEASFPKDATIDSLCAILFSNAASKAKGLSLEKFREEKVIQTTGTHGGSYITGASDPLTTEKGLVRLYMEKPVPRLNYGQDLSARFAEEHVVYYREPEEVGIDNPLREKYPFVYLQEHSRFRVHTQWDRTPILRELDPEPLAKINSIDAASRGVESGDMVEVFNDRGRCVLKCLIDESIAPGIVSIPKGWPRSAFKEGGYQEMTQPKMDPYPSAASPYDALVDFRKA